MALSTSLFYRSNVIFLLALICGIILPQELPVGNILLLPALMVILQPLLCLRFPRGFFRCPGPLLSASIQGNVMNYLVLGNFIILSSIFLIHKQELWVGMVLIAAVPPPVDIILLGNLLRTDKASIFYRSGRSLLGRLINHTVNRFRVF